jgi:hypothetical protein
VYQKFRTLVRFLRFRTVFVLSGKQFTFFFHICVSEKRVRKSTVQDCSKCETLIIAKLQLSSNFYFILKMIIAILFLLSLFSRVSSECANACNGHGRCTSFDMCICNRNWQAADCSERVCQFGLAHVDTPKVRQFSLV